MKGVTVVAGFVETKALYLKLMTIFARETP